MGRYRPHLVNPHTLIATYIMASRRNGTLYTGVTSDLYQRVWRHKTGYFSAGFATKYGCKMLVWFETAPDMATAIRREKLIKHWDRTKKLGLIEADNSEWRDLSAGWYDDETNG